MPPMDLTTQCGLTIRMTMYGRTQLQLTLYNKKHFNVYRAHGLSCTPSPPLQPLPPPLRLRLNRLRQTPILCGCPCVQPTQHTVIAPGTETLDLTVDENHGRCNVVMVGVVTSTDQHAQLTAYSQRFQVGGSSLKMPLFG